MSGSFVRPRVSELIFRLFDRPLHPELFASVASRVVRRDGYVVAARLTPTGHVLNWTDGRVHLVEVMATVDMELPGGQRLGHRLVGGGAGRESFTGGVRYQVSSQMERLAPELFRHVHAELEIEGLRKGLVFHCKTGNRLELSPLGVVIATNVPGGLSVTTFHTFPAEFALIKTQSLIEWAEAR
jgi:hypothetical protein